MQKNQAAAALGRSRPTNNQLLYKAHFRWEHYGPDPDNHLKLPTDTEACASVTAAFLKVLAILHTLEVNQHPSRNILMILANNTRRTKVLELSSGTHRIPDELKKHHLIDENGAQYSTNLDRNRYGNDNNYLFTVIKHDLETLGLCPCLVDVEIIDAKSLGDSQLVTAGLEACSCVAAGGQPAAQVDPEYFMPGIQPQALQSRGRPEAAPSWPRAPIKANRSEGEGSQLFEALLVAADVAAEEQNEADNLLLLNNRNRGARSPLRRGGQGNFDTADAAAVRRRAPKRVLTGLFSVDTSDFIGLSNLGQSGLAICDTDPDRRGEVNQGVLKKVRSRGRMDARKETDVMSEEGDTDARNMRDDDGGVVEERAPAVRRGGVPRQSSGIISNHHRLPPNDVRRINLELESLKHNQMQLSRTMEAQGLGHFEQAVMKLQEDYQELKEHVHSLTLSNTEQHKRATALTMELAQSRQETATLFKLLRGQGGVAPAIAAALAGQLGGPANDLLPAQPEAPPARSLLGATAPGGATLSPLLRNGNGQPQPLDSKLTQFSPLSRLGGSALGHIASTNVIEQHLDTSKLAGLANVVSREGLDAMVDDPQWREDNESLKALPRFENFGSLSDLGSLFSVGQQSKDFLKSVHRPPCATHSVTSPSPQMLAALSKSATLDRTAGVRQEAAKGEQEAQLGREGAAAGQHDAHATFPVPNSVPAKATEATC